MIPDRTTPDDDSIPIIEASLRGVAGLGVGYTAINLYRQKYGQVKKSFLGLPTSNEMKQAFTRVWQFSGEFFRKIELDQSLSIEQYTQFIPHQSQMQEAILDVLRMKREIRTILRQSKRVVDEISENSTKIGVSKGTIDQAMTPFLSFKENFDKNAIALDEAITGEAYRGKIEKLETDQLRTLRWDQIKSLAGKLGVMKQQAHKINDQMRDVRTQVRKTVEQQTLRLNQNLAKQLSKEGESVVAPMKGAADQVTSILNQVGDSIQKMTSFSGWTQPIILKRPEPIYWPVRADLTDLTRDVSLRKLIGKQGVRSIGKMVRDSYKDSILGSQEDDIVRMADEKLLRQEFVKNVKATVRELQVTGQFSNVEVGILKADNDAFMVRAVPKNAEAFGGEDIILRYEIPKRKLGRMVINKGGKEFFVPFNRQNDLLVNQSRVYLARIARALYDPSTAQESFERMRSSVINQMQYSKSALSDFIRSSQIDQKLTHRESKNYLGGWQAFDKIVKNKLGKGAILHIDTEFGPDKFPTQVGWVLMDWKGHPIDGYHFSIGGDAAAKVPAHFKAREMGGHKIVQNISRDDVHKVVEALQSSMNHPRAYGGMVQIAGKNWGMAEAQTIENLLSHVEKKKLGGQHAIAQIRSSIAEQTVIDVNTLPTVHGENVFLSGAHLFRLMRTRLANAGPEAKAAVEARLKVIGINDLGEVGQMLFEKGLHSGFQDAYMQGLYAEVLYMTSKKGRKGQAGIKKAMSEIKNGFMPKTIASRYIPDGRSIEEMNLNLSGQSILGGKLETSWANMGGTFPDRRPGLEYRPVPSMQVRRMDSSHTIRRINKELLRMRKLGVEPDVAQVVRRHLNDMKTKSVVFLDPGDTSLYRKDEVFFRSIYGRRFSMPDPKIYNVTTLAPRMGKKSIEVGDEVGFGSAGGSLLGWDNNKEIHFEGRDKAQSGVVTSIQANEDGTWRLVLDRKATFGTMTPVITGSGAGLVSNRILEEVLPNLRPGYTSARTAEYAEKPGSNPGAAVADMFNLLFHHAGNDPVKKQVLKSILKTHFSQKGINAGFPVTERASGAMFLEFDVRNRDFWRENFSNVNVGDYIDIANEYNLKTGGTFTFTNMVLTGGNTSHDEIMKEAMVPALRTLSNLGSDTGFVEANLRFAFRSMKRETSHSEITRMAKNARDLMSEGKVLEAMRIMRPDAVFNDTYDIFRKTAAMFGFARVADLGWRPVGISKDVTNVTDLDVISGWGATNTTGLGMDFMEKMRMLKGSESMVKLLREKLFEQNPVTIARMFGLPIMSGTHPIKGMKMVSAANSQSFLETHLSKWLNLTVTGNMKGWIPTEKMYEIDGQIVNESMAAEKLGIPNHRFDEAIRSGRAKEVPFSMLRSRMRAPEDVQELFNLHTSGALIHFGRSKSVQVRGETALARIDRFLMTAPTRGDYFPVEMTKTVNGKRFTKSFLIESPLLDKQRQIGRAIVSGLDPNNNLLQEMYDLQTDAVIKRNLDVHMKTKMVPVIALKQNLFTEYPQVVGDVTTRDHAMTVLGKMFNTKSVNKKMFLHGEGLMLGEGRFVGMTEELVDKELRQMFSTYSDDTLKAMASRVLGNVKVGERSISNPRGFMLRVMAGEVKVGGGGFNVDANSVQYANDALGMLRAVAGAKQVGKEMRQGMLDLVLGGVAQVPIFGEKAPLADQTKFVSGWFSKGIAGSQDRQQLAARMGTGTGGIGIVFHGSMVEGNIDRDKDFVKILMEHADKYLKIMDENSFLPAVPHHGGVPAVVVAGKEGGNVTFINTISGEAWNEPMAKMNMLMDFDKTKTIEKMIFTKQLAGKTTVVGDNVAEYMWRYLSKSAGKLGNDMGQKDIHKIMYNVMEMKGVLLENILKGKSVNAAGQTILNLMDDISSVKGVRALRENLERAVGDDPSHPLRKLYAKVPELNQYFQGTGGLNWFDMWEMALKSGRTGDMATGYLSADEILVGTNFKTGDLHTKRGAMWRAISDNELLGNIPTKFNPMQKEKLLTSIKRNLQGDMDAKTWERVGKGMGWVAAAGAVFMATNMFREDDNAFLGNRPGVGGEAYDYTFTRPEYEMAGVLDTPFSNPFSKNRAYVQMNNPVFASKMAKMSDREQRDMSLFHEAMAPNQIRSSFKSVGRKENRDYKQLLQRYGHV